LKAFMEYCQGSEENRQEAGVTRHPEPFEAAIQDAISRMGYQVDAKVGLGNYQIDLAIRNPKNEEEYALAVECDGNSYASAQTARDREWLRENTLRNMRWKRVLRLWSREWMEQPKVAAQSLKKAIEEACAACAEEKEGETTPPEIPLKADPPVINELTVDPGLATPVEWEAHLRAMAYIPYAAPQKAVLGLGKPASDLIKEIVRREQPVHEEVVYERWKECFIPDGSTENRKKKLFAHIMEQLMAQNRVRKQDGFLWLPGQSGQIVPRFPPDGQTPRKVEHIALEEIAALAQQVMTHVYGISRSTLARKTSELLGYRILNAGRQERIDAAIEWMVGQGLAVVNGEAVLPKDVGGTQS
jgi:very-short-patch-repair endonuclease